LVGLAAMIQLALQRHGLRYHSPNGPIVLVDQSAAALWLKISVKALVELQALKPATPEDRIIFSERDIGISPKALAIWFLTLYRELGFKGASSHSGRRTFITKAAKRCIEGGGSLRDVQQLAGHSSLATTQRYIEGSSDAKRRIVDLIS
jgi:integrase